jgi:hypothetical protein
MMADRFAFMVSAERKKTDDARLVYTRQDFEKWHRPKSDIGCSNCWLKILYYG